MNVCCFCSTPLDPNEAGSLTFVVAAARRLREADKPTQQMWCHAQCLGDRLASRVVFDPAAFDA
jgi:hypothetical protein